MNLWLSGLLKSVTSQLDLSPARLNGVQLNLIVSLEAGANHTAKVFQMNDQIVRADKRLRNKLILVIAAFVVLGILAMQEVSSILDGIRNLRETDPELGKKKLISLLNTISVVHALVSAAFAVYLLSIGIKTIKEGRYPPGGMKVIRDTKLLVGNKATFLAFAYICFTLLILSTNAIIWQLRVILVKLG